MANEEQLALLKAGVEGWNKWREEKPDEKIDLSKANLIGADLRGANLLLADLTGANLILANLSGANLAGAQLKGAQVDKADLSGADLRVAYLREVHFIEVDLRGVDLFQADLEGAYLGGAKLSGVDLGGAKLGKANLIGADLSGADLGVANLRGARLPEANLRGASLIQADLTWADLSGANLSEARLIQANLQEANLKRANLIQAILLEANLSGAYLGGADLSGANLQQANLSGANLQKVNLREADLRGASLMNTSLVQANISNAKISKSKVYGVSVWDLEGEFKEQKDLIITPKLASPITVDNIKVAQFVYLILNNKEIRDVINTLTSKTVLILGRFAIAERKAILDALRDKLREYDLLPIVFDFDRPTDQDFTETIKTLASISYFVIADVTNPQSAPLELQATIPDYQIPFVPIIQEGEKPFSMMKNLKSKYSWVLKTVSYDSVDTLIEILKPLIIDPAMKKRTQLRKTKAKKPRITSGRKWRAMKNESKP